MIPPLKHSEFHRGDSYVNHLMNLGRIMVKYKVERRRRSILLRKGLVKDPTQVKIFKLILN